MHLSLNALDPEPCFTAGAAGADIVPLDASMPKARRLSGYIAMELV